MADQNLEAASVAQAGVQADARAAAPSDSSSGAAPLASAETEDAPGRSAEESARTRARLLDLARVDSDNAARLAQSQLDFARRGELLYKAVPEKYLEIVAALRTAVRTYNDALRQNPENPVPYCQWYESPNVALREPVAGDGMRVRLSRITGQFELVLRFVNRHKKPDVPLIEGYGEFGKDLNRRRVLLRIEGWVEHGEIRYWYNLDFKRQHIPLHEVPDRIVMAVVSSDYSHLSREYTDEDEHFGASLPGGSGAGRKS